MSTMNFIVDTIGDEQLDIKTELVDEDEKIDSTDFKTKLESILEICKTKRLELDRLAKIEEERQKKLTTSKIDKQFDDFFTEMGWSLIPGIPSVKKEKRERKFHFSQLDLDSGKLKTSLGEVDVEKEMQNSVLKPGIEKEHSLPQYQKSDKKLKAERKKEREKTKGPAWFNMAVPEMTEEVKNDLQVLKMRSALDPKTFKKRNDMEVLPKYFQKEREKTKGPAWFNMAVPEMTEEVKNDLQILKMRSALDPKTFKKRNDMEVLPKYFQVGRVMDSALEHQSERIRNKQRKRTMVDELLADAEFHKYNKRKYKQIIEERRKTEYRTHMRDKRQKNKAELKKNRDSNKKNKK